MPEIFQKLLARVLMATVLSTLLPLRGCLLGRSHSHFGCFSSWFEARGLEPSSRRLASVPCGSFLPQSASISSNAGGAPCPHTAGRMGASPFPASSSYQTEGILLTAGVLTHGAPAVPEARAEHRPHALLQLRPG